MASLRNDGCTFCLGHGIHYVWLNGAVVRATWPDHGSALAGLEVEKRRLAARSVSMKPSQQGTYEKELGPELG